MRYAGLDIAKKRHLIAVVDQDGERRRSPRASGDHVRRVDVRAGLDSRSAASAAAGSVSSSAAKHVLDHRGLLTEDVLELEPPGRGAETGPGHLEPTRRSVERAFTPPRVP